MTLIRIANLQKQNHMKDILFISMLCLSLSGCSQDRVKIDMNYGTLISLISSGTLFDTKDGMIDTYFYWGVEDKSFNQGYVLLNFHRKCGKQRMESNDSKAYKLLDSLDTAHKMKDVDLDHSNWGAEDKKFFHYLFEHYFEMMARFNQHVKCYIEKGADSKGISYNSILVYE